MNDAKPTSEDEGGERREEGEKERGREGGTKSEKRGEKGRGSY